jgi:hypothetical protein
LAAIFMTVLATLTGCAGGGGGGGGLSEPPFGGVYPPLATASTTHTGDGVSEAYSLSPDSNQMISTTSDISVAPNSPTAGKITITVSGIPVPRGLEPDFSVTVDPATDLTILANSPLGGSTLSPPCADCLTTGEVTASDGQTVTFIYLDPDSVNLTYSAMGLWSKPSFADAGTVVGGAFSIGVLTRGSDLPTTGTATYDGFFVGRYATSDTVTAGAPAPGIYTVGANAHGAVDFSGAGSVIFSTLNTSIVPEGSVDPPLAAPRLDLLSSPMTITRTDPNSFSGPVTTNGFGMSGTISGAFYGKPATIGTPAPPELGGALAVGNNAGTQNMVGSFALKKN